MQSELKAILKRNTKLIVGLASSGVNDYYDSRIEDINDDALLISMPTKKGMPVPVMKGSVLSLSILTDSGRVSLESKVMTIVTDPIYMLCITIPDSYRREQMRQFYRVDSWIKVLYYESNIVDYKLALKAGELLKSFEGHIGDISGGGCKLSCNSDLKEGDHVVIDFEGTVIEELGAIECRVVRVNDVPDEVKKFISLSYTDIDEKSRDKIVRYVFRRQMELRQVTD